MITRGRGLFFLKNCRRCNIPFRPTSRYTKICDSCYQPLYRSVKKTLFKKNGRLLLV
jgi:hypothetical protein